MTIIDVNWTRKYKMASICVRYLFIIRFQMHVQTLAFVNKYKYAFVNERNVASKRISICDAEWIKFLVMGTKPRFYVHVEFNRLI